MLDKRKIKGVGLSALAIVVFCISMAFSAAAFALDIGDCKVLALDMNNNWDNEALNNLGISYSFVSPTTFIQADLTQYDVIFVSSAFRDGWVRYASQAGLDALNEKADDIHDFVYYGGGVVALSEPIGLGKWAWTPVPLETFGCSCGWNDVKLLNPEHPVNSELSSGHLSYWYASWHNYFISYPSSLEPLSENADGNVLSLAGMLGRGKMFFTGQDPDFHRWQYGAKTLLGNALKWTCEKAVIMVDIDIKPGSDPNSININSKGVIPVAVLTTEDFNAEDVDAETVRFGPNEAYPEHYALEDVDDDGDIDLILHFRTRDTGIAAGDTEALLTGETYEGQAIEGSDGVRVLENKGKKK